jgi:AraC family transcriptional activator of mtrCDE
MPDDGVAKVARNGSPDALSVLAHLLHVQDVRCERHSGAQWTTDHEADCGGVAFQIVTHGACAIELMQLRHSVRLEAGDVAVLPHGNRHIARGQATASADGLASADAPSTAGEWAERETQLIGGWFVLEHPRENFVLAALPDLIVVRAAESADAARLHRLIIAIADELDARRPGARAIADDLASALFMMIVRIHLDRERTVEGLLHILGHRRAARAMQAMLTSPGRAWTLDELAGHASASRASLVRMFQKTVRMAPLEFLAELRLGLARRKLAATNLPLVEIAAEAGYRSESSFSRAFRRRFGMAPGRVRTLQMKSGEIRPQSQLQCALPWSR